jgi:VWFA-related protein
MSRSALLCAFLLALGISLPLRAGEEPRQAFDDAIDVRVVNVEAVVTGRGGERVRGLTAADFRLLVDGKEVPVEYFAEVAEGAAVSTPSAASGGGAPVAPGEEVGKNYLVFIDESLALQSQRDDMLKRIADDLSLLRPADRMAVLAFDRLNISVLAPWTNDAAALRAALERERQRPARGIISIVHQRSADSDAELVRQVTEATQEKFADAGPSRGDQLQHSLSGLPGVGPAVSDTHKAADAATAALRAFGAPPGRKVMLLVTGAWTFQTAPGFYRPLLTAANQLGYSVYPVDAAKSGAYAINIADSLARFTGGRAVTPADNRIFRQVVEDTASYYWLGFTPSGKESDRARRVVVEVRRPGLAVRSRGGFSDLSKRTENLLKAESVLLFGGAPEDRRLLVQLGKPRRTRLGLEVPVALGVPAEALVLSADLGGYRMVAPMAVVVLDEKGGRAELRTEIKLTMAQAPDRPGLYARFETVILLRDAKQRVVFTVPDSVTGRALWGDIEFGGRK